MDILGSQVHPLVQVLFPYIDGIFQDDDSPIHTARSVQSWFEEHEDAFQHHLRPAESHDLNIIEPLVSFTEQGEKQIPSIISQATRKRLVQYSTRDCSELNMSLFQEGYKQCYRQMVTQIHINTLRTGTFKLFKHPLPGFLTILTL